VLSSSYTVGHAQRDGRRYVSERHETDDGQVIEQSYLAATDADYEAILQDHAAQIDASLALFASEQTAQAAALAKVLAILGVAVSKGEITDDEVVLVGIEGKTK
jgi:uncharacterized protein YyaL (SSP411 family)